MRNINFFKWLNPASKKEITTPGFLQAYVHPCVINKQPHIVYAKGLQQNSPALFAKLSQHYQQQGFRLKEDQRSGSCSEKHKNERRKWVPIVLFTASLMFESSVFADEDTRDIAAQQFQNIELQMIPKNIILAKIHYSVKPISKPKERTEIKSRVAQVIFDELKSRYKKQKDDPGYIVEDLKEIANYFSGFPESIALIDDLKNKNWMLSYDEDSWVTTGSGSMMQVDKAVIHFNTRSAAQLRLNNGCSNNPVCIASPADALLHELLHVHSMLVEGEESIVPFIEPFIEHGGMNNVLYPYKHEYAVIDAERNLYASMSMQDKIKRPQRREHTGRLVRASCATCIK